MMELIIHSDGTINCIYAEAIPIQAIGSLTIQRASHVEPNDDGEWIADMSPVKGPLLGPFANRSKALEAETLWLRNNLLNGGN